VRTRQMGLEEWIAPRITQLTFLPYWSIAGALVALAVSARIWRRTSLGYEDGTIVMSALAFLPLSLSSARNVSPFLLLATAAVATLVDRVFPTAASAEQPQENRSVTRIAVATAAVMLLVLGGVGYAWTAPLRRLEWQPLPDGAIAAIDACPEHLYNDYYSGGYVTWFAKNQRVFVDSRQDPYPLELIGAQVAVERTGEYQDLFRRYGIRCALISANSVLDRRLTQDGWERMYGDPVWRVYASR
jgi:hypothetical protein